MSSMISEFLSSACGLAALDAGRPARDEGRLGLPFDVGRAPCRLPVTLSDEAPFSRTDLFFDRRAAPFFETSGVKSDYVPPRRLG